jgi:hypothetical protein
MTGIPVRGAMMTTADRDTPISPTAAGPPRAVPGPAPVPTATSPTLPAANARSTDPATWTKLLAAFERLFSIGVLYPEGHARCVGVATEFQQELRRDLGGRTVLTIDATREALAIEECVVPTESRAARRIQRTMTTLGISRLEIEATATPADIYALVKLLLRLMHEAETTRGFHTLEFEGLPATVHLSLREFSQQSEISGESTGTIQPQTAPGVGILEVRGLSAETREAVGELIQDISLRAVQEAPVRAQPGRTAPAGGAPARNEAARAPATGAPAARAATTTKGGGTAFGMTVEGAGVTVATSGDPAGGTAGDLSGPPCVETDGSDQEYRLELGELQRRFDEVAGDAPPRPNLADRAEQIGTLTQLLMGGVSAAALDGIDEQLEQCLGDPVREREMKVLRGALADLLVASDEELVDRCLPRLLRPLRGTRTLGRLLAETAAAAGLEIAAWPHVVNEMLVGLEHTDEPTFLALATETASLPEGAMRTALPRLARLDAMREHRLAPRLFRLPQQEFAGLFALLLTSPGADMSGPWLLEQLRAHPPAWPGTPALFLLGDFGTGNRSFLVRLLRETARGEYSRELLLMAEQIITRGLKLLPSGQRGGTWVAKAVRVLGEVPTPVGVALLASIQRQRRLLVLHAWPAACRLAAAQAQLAAAAIRDGGGAEEASAIGAWPQDSEGGCGT